MAKILIVIPSRYHSKRLPGKPLIKIAGKEMIKRVAEIAHYVCKQNESCEYVVATDDNTIYDFCSENGINVTMTPESCKNGTERCQNVIKNLNPEDKPELIINLQGDNPLCPPWILQDIIDAWREDNSAAVYTPCVTLSWDEYDRMVEAKKITPHSGTTVMVDKYNNALAFSKNIIPAIRKAEEAKIEMRVSPVKRHVGLYAYSYETLSKYSDMNESVYEKNSIEGLEQMRFLYNGLKIRMVEADYRGRATTSGVDAPEDISRVEEIISKYGEFDLSY